MIMLFHTIKKTFLLLLFCILYFYIFRKLLKEITLYLVVRAPGWGGASYKRGQGVRSSPCILFINSKYKYFDHTS